MHEPVELWTNDLSMRYPFLYILYILSFPLNRQALATLYDEQLMEIDWLIVCSESVDIETGFSPFSSKTSEKVNDLTLFHPNLWRNGYSQPVWETRGWLDWNSSPAREHNQFQRQQLTFDWSLLKTSKGNMPVRALSAYNSFLLSRRSDWLLPDKRPWGLTDQYRTLALPKSRRLIQHSAVLHKCKFIISLPIKVLVVSSYADGASQLPWWLSPSQQRIQQYRNDRAWWGSYHGQVWRPQENQSNGCYWLPQPEHEG